MKKGSRGEAVKGEERRAREGRDIEARGKNERKETTEKGYRQEKQRSTVKGKDEREGESI